MSPVLTLCSLSLADSRVQAVLQDDDADAEEMARLAKSREKRLAAKMAKPSKAPLDDVPREGDQEGKERGQCTNNCECHQEDHATMMARTTCRKTHRILESTRKLQF